MNFGSICFGIAVTAGLLLLLELVACTKGEPYVVEYRDSVTRRCKFVTVDDRKETCDWLDYHDVEPDEVILAQSAAMDKWRKEEGW